MSKTNRKKASPSKNKKKSARAPTVLRASHEKVPRSGTKKALKKVPRSNSASGSSDTFSSTSKKKKDDSLSASASSRPPNKMAPTDSRESVAVGKKSHYKHGDSTEDSASSSSDEDEDRIISPEEHGPPLADTESEVNPKKPAASSQKEPGKDSGNDTSHQSEENSSSNENRGQDAQENANQQHQGGYVITQLPGYKSADKHWSELETLFNKGNHFHKSDYDDVLQDAAKLMSKNYMHYNKGKERIILEGFRRFGGMVVTDQSVSEKVLAAAVVELNHRREFDNSDDDHECIIIHYHSGFNHHL